MKVQFIIVGILASAILTSCFNEVYVDMPGNKPKLVVNCFISPQLDTIRALITQSNPLAASPDDPQTDLFVDNARVVISNNDNQVILTFDDDEKVYKIAASLLPVIAGQSYSFSCASADGREVTASCTVPNDNVSFTANYRPADENQNNGSKYIVEWNWQNNAQEVCVRLFGEAELEWQNGTQLSRNYEKIELEREFFSSTPGIEHTFRGDYRSSNAEYSRRQFQLSLLIVDEHYRKYHQSLDYYPTDDPFAEPAPTYSNVQGGLGIFAAYNQKKLSMDF